MCPGWSRSQRGEIFRRQTSQTRLQERPKMTENSETGYTW